jgi:hypothetical protein
MTNEDFLKWLRDPAAIRCILLEVRVKIAGVETTRYLSNRGYVTGGGDAPANTAYSSVICGGVKFTESISMEGNATMSMGDVEIDNTTGERDSWLNDSWKNRQISLFVGDVRWVRSEFTKVFEGVVTGIDSKSRGKLNLKLGDKLQRLNTPVTDVKLLGSTSNKDKLIPLCFGECHNVSPLLVDGNVNEFQVHNGAIESIIEVRDNGVPVAFTPLLSTGKFRLLKQPVGTITASVQGALLTQQLDGAIIPSGVYSNTIASIAINLATLYGNSMMALTMSDMDTTLVAFNTANTQPVGLYLSDRANLLETINKLASSVGARVVMTRGNLLRFVKLSLTGLPVGTTVTSTDMVDKSLAISDMPAIVAGVKVGYCKNYTVQSNLETGIPAEHISLFSEEWLTTTRTDSVAKAENLTYVEPDLQETLLLTAATALAEADRRLAIFNTQRKVFRYTGFGYLLLENLGSSQTIKHPRFGLSAGATGQIVSISLDWANPYITMEVLV